MRHRLSACALLLPTALPAAAFGQETTTLRTTCAPAPSPAAQAPDLAGLWDFYIDAGGEPSFGLLTISRLDANYSGTLTPVRTAPLIVRSLALSGSSVKLTVASREGDVTYNATLDGASNRLCGTVDYHGGRKYPMVAQRRPGASPAAAR